MTLFSRYARAARKGRRRKHLDPTGLKRWKVHPTSVALTPYGAKLRRKRRAARKVAHESRRRNRA